MNRLTVLAAVLAALAVPSAASAATLDELPFQPRPDRSEAGCLTTVGDGLALVGPSTRRESPAELLAVTAAGAEPRDRAPLARTFECPAIAGAPGGAAVVAGITVSEDFEVALQALARDAGGRFGAPVTLSHRGASPVAAVGAGGHAVVAWAERPSGRTWRIVAARRAPGGAFGPAETLVTWRMDPQDVPDVEIAAAVDGAGGVSLAWMRELPYDGGDEHVEAATAAPGGPFAVQRLASDVSTDDGPVIAGAADGTVVTAFHIGRTGGLRAFERTPGGGTFAAAALPALPDEARRPWPADLAVAVRDGGGAVLAWRAGDVDYFRGIEAVTRASAGAFGPVRTVAGRSGPAVQEAGGDLFEVELGLNPFDPFAGPAIDDDERRLAAALSPDGRVVLAWTAPSGRRPLWAATAHAATGRLDGAFDGVQRLGAPLRDAADVAALFADGRAAVAWTDNAGVASDGRLHVAVEGAPAPPDPPAPRLTLRAPRLQRLFENQPLRVVAGCDGPCDLRTGARGPDGRRTGTGARTRLRAGSAAVAVGRIDGVERGRPRTVRVTVHATAPGGRRTAVRTVRVRVARRASLPLRRPLGVTARRRGDEIVVRWRTAAPARRQWFLVAGQAKGAGVEPAFPGTLAYVRGGGHTRFTVRLRPSARFRVPRIVVVASSDDTSAERYVQVKVR